MSGGFFYAIIFMSMRLMISKMNHFSHGKISPKGFDLCIAYQNAWNPNEALEFEACYCKRIFNLLSTNWPLNYLTFFKRPSLKETCEK
ncbi:MAG: hypothetical protein RLZZ262_189 [Bacteroidota bacterium]